MSEKLQKVLARAGLGSRRQAEEWIQEGRVKVNGQVAHLGERVELDAQISVDGKILHLSKITPKQQVLIYHKPVGEICTRHDPSGRKTVFDSLPKVQGRWVSVGRLDINTSGLLLFCNDGELANQLMHPKTHIEREYAVRILGTLSSEDAERLTHGINLEDGHGRFEHIVEAGGEGANHWYHLVCMEGRNRFVRRMFEACNLVVNRLIRVRYGSLMLPRGLKQGMWRILEGEDLQKLLDDCHSKEPDS
ncbi:MAG TPA: pseudouridine synthase [Coxiellaceae bacterium]|nr:pseudouridine synthase [Coxiellaceae bacterium]